MLMGGHCLCLLLLMGESVQRLAKIYVLFKCGSKIMSQLGVSMNASFLS